MNTNTLIAASNFFDLAAVAANNGGFWVSAAGGTVSTAAGIISRATGDSFHEAVEALDIIGREEQGEDWYCSLWAGMPQIDPEQFRWSVNTIAKAAVKRLEEKQ